MTKALLTHTLTSFWRKQSCLCYIGLATTTNVATRTAWNGAPVLYKRPVGNILQIMALRKIHVAAVIIRIILPEYILI